jgi:hypothetical protein
MSDGDQPKPPEQPPWNPALRALLFLVGFVLLLPGICTVFSIFDYLRYGTDLLASVLLVAWVTCLAASFGGALIIWAAWRHRSSWRPSHIRRLTEVFGVAAAPIIAI